MMKGGKEGKSLHAGGARDGVDGRKGPVEAMVEQNSLPPNLFTPRVGGKLRSDPFYGGRWTAAAAKVVLVREDSRVSTLG